ncbi:MFS transporter [Lactobacillus hilgardii]
MQKSKNHSLTQILTVLLIILIGANMRTALTAVPPILTNISSSFNLPDWFLGSLTTIPLLCFALISPFVNRLSRKFGMLTTIIAALIGLLIGSFIRIYSFSTLLIGTLLIGGSIAILNVLSPTMVAEFYPRKIGLMTSAYTLSMTIFSALSAGLSAPISSKIGWQPMLQWLVIFPILTLLIAFGSRGRKHPQQSSRSSFNPTAQLKPVWRQPLAWYLTVFMGLQSFLFYTVLTWLPSIFISHGINQNRASLLLGLLQLASLPTAYFIPNLAGRLTKQAPLVWTIFGLFILGLGGLLLNTASMTIAVIICILLGFATSSAFSMSMILFSLKTANPYETSAVSGMAQSIGYLAAAIGPLLSGLIHGAIASWWPVIVMMLIVVVIQTSFGLLVDSKQSVFGE